MTEYKPIMRAAPCTCGAEWPKLEISGFGDGEPAPGTVARYYVRCTVCKNCERGASLTHELAVSAWNDACWGSPTWRKAFDERREQRFRQALRDYADAGARAIAEDIDRKILDQL